jgi:hypothetical protein
LAGRVNFANLRWYVFFSLRWLKKAGREWDVAMRKGISRADKITKEMALMMEAIRRSFTVGQRPQSVQPSAIIICLFLNHRCHQQSFFLNFIRHFNIASGIIKDFKL